MYHQIGSILYTMHNLDDFRMSCSVTPNCLISSACVIFGNVERANDIRATLACSSPIILLAVECLHQWNDTEEVYQGIQPKEHSQWGTRDGGKRRMNNQGKCEEPLCYDIRYLV